jgi:hypothetical protein
MCLKPNSLEIDPDWKNVVGEAVAQSLQAKQAQQQMAIWELLTTEVSHIKLIKVVIDVFIACLDDLLLNEHTKSFFNDINKKKLFCNIIDVYNCNVKFWNDYLERLVIKKDSSSHLIDPSELKMAFYNVSSMKQQEK